MQTTISPKPPTSLPSRLWRGEVPLAETYWFYGVVLSMAIGLAARFAGLVPGSSAAKLFLLALLLYWGFISISIWRSANRYRGRQLWARLAKWAVVLSALPFIIPLVVMIFL